MTKYLNIIMTLFFIVEIFPFIREGFKWGQAHFTRRVTFSIFCFVFWNTQSFAFECHPVAHVNQSQRFDCAIPTGTDTKTFHVLKLVGSFPQITYDHGYLLAEEAAQGVIKEVHRSFEEALHEGSFAQNALKKKIFQCFKSKMTQSLSREFLAAAQTFYQGMKKGLSQQGLPMPYMEEEIFRAIIGIDLDIIFEGLSRRIEKDPWVTYMELAATCGLRTGFQAFKDFLGLVGHLSFGLKLGCLGFVAPDSVTLTNGLLHARNLDADLMETWNKSPTLFLVDEPGHYRYVAAAGAGIIYPGGISGFNEKGIAVSLHEMSTDQYATQYSGRRGVSAPFLQQRILREAATVDEAIRLVQSAGNFGGWTILVSDSKTNEVVSIEFSGKRVEVARRVQNAVIGQSNHFLAPNMQDQFFTYNFNKKLESDSRLQVITAALQADRGRIDVDWAVEHLAGHTDSTEGFRSFGRTATKVYTMMSFVMIPQQNEMWVTLGNKTPASHGLFLGFHIDFQEGGFQPLEIKRVSTYESLPHWEESLFVYAKARIFYQRNHKELAEHQVSRAIQWAAQDNIHELPYYYIRARLRHELGRTKEAQEDFEFLLNQKNKLHPYQQALVLLYASVNQGGSISRLREAENIFKHLNQKTPHFDLDRKLNMVKKLQHGKKLTELPKIDFVTIE